MGESLVSKSRLNPLRGLHLTPINLVIFKETNKDFLSWGSLRT